MTLLIQPRTIPGCSQCCERSRVCSPYSNVTQGPSSPPTTFPRLLIKVKSRDPLRTKQDLRWRHLKGVSSSWPFRSFTGESLRLTFRQVAGVASCKQTVSGRRLGYNKSGTTFSTNIAVEKTEFVYNNWIRSTGIWHSLLGISQLAAKFASLWFDGLTFTRVLHAVQVFMNCF